MRARGGWLSEWLYVWMRVFVLVCVCVFCVCVCVCVYACAVDGLSEWLYVWMRVFALVCVCVCAWVCILGRYVIEWTLVHAHINKHLPSLITPSNQSHTNERQSRLLYVSAPPRIFNLPLHKITPTERYHHQWNSCLSLSMSERFELAYSRSVCPEHQNIWRRSIHTMCPCRGEAS